MNLDIIENFYNHILKYKKYLLLFFIIFFIFNLTNIDKFKLDASADTLILENDEDYKFFKRINNIFPNNDFLVLAYKSKNKKIDDNYIKNISKLKYELEKLDGIESTFSIIDAPIILSTNSSLTDLNVNNIKTILSKEINFSEGLNELKNSPIFSEQIINIEGNVSSIIAYLSKDKILENIITNRDKLKEDYKIDKSLKKELKNININYEKQKNIYNINRHNLILDVRKVIKKLELNDDIFLGGVSMIADDSLEFVKKDIKNFGIGVFAFIIIILFILFRNIKWVILPLITTSFSVISMISLLGIIGWKITVISSNFISLMFILTISMNIHIIVRYQLISKEDKNIKNISKTMKEMFAPCIYTSLTTIVAFLSLVFSDIRPVIDFGWIMTLGLIITFFSSFTILPILISFFPKTNIYKNSNMIILNNLYLSVKNYGIIIIVFNLLFIILSIWGINQLKVENSFINYFKKDTEIYKGMKLIDKELGGTTPLDITIKFKDEKQENKDNSEEESLLNLDSLFDSDSSNNIDYWITPEKLEIIKFTHNYLKNRKEIGKVQSVQQFIDVAEQINKGTLNSFEIAILYKNIPDDIKNNLLSSYISLDNNMIKFNTRIIDSADIERNKLIKEIKKDLNKNIEDIDWIEVNGLLVLYNNMLQSLFGSQIKSLGFVLASIFIMFLILFKSFNISVAGIVPNIFAALFILGLIGLFKIPLDMMTITIAAITIGIAVDNSIHYIYRIKKELQNHDSLLKTIEKCHLTVGNAILTTSITIAFGFTILLLSNFIPTIYFGIFTSIAMIVAMLGILTTLPKLLLIFNIKK